MQCTEYNLDHISAILYVHVYYDNFEILTLYTACIIQKHIICIILYDCIIYSECVCTHIVCNCMHVQHV